jgi:hypothetical protein
MDALATGTKGSKKKTSFNQICHHEPPVLETTLNCDRPSTKKQVNEGSSYSYFQTALSQRGSGRNGMKEGGSICKVQDIIKKKKRTC